MPDSIETLADRPDEEIESLQREIREFDLDRINRQLLGDGVDDVEELEEQFRQFLCDFVEDPSPHPNPPTEDVDMYWHKFILDTELYRTFCEEVLGFYLHHSVPSESSE